MPRKLSANEVADSLRSPNYTVRVLGGAKHSAVGWAITWGKRKLIALATQLRRSTIQRQQDIAGKVRDRQAVVFDRRYYFSVNKLNVTSIEIYFNAFAALWTLTIRTVGGGLDIVRVPTIIDAPRFWFREEGSVKRGRLTAIRLSSGDDVVSNITAVRAPAIADRIEYGLTDEDDVDDHTRRSLSERCIEKGLTTPFMDLNHRNQFALIKSPPEWIAEGMYPYVALAVQFLNYDFEFAKATVCPVFNIDNPDELGVGMSASISGTPGSFTREQRTSLITISFPIEPWWRSNGTSELYPPSGIINHFPGFEGPQVFTSDSDVLAGGAAVFTFSDFPDIVAGIVPAAEGAFTVEDTVTDVPIPGGTLRAISTISGFVSGGVASSVSIAATMAIKTGTMPDFVAGIDLTDQVFQVNNLIPGITSGAGVMPSDRVGIDGEDHPDDAANKWHQTGTGSATVESEIFISPGTTSPGSYEFPGSYLLSPVAGAAVDPVRYTGTDVSGGRAGQSVVGTMNVNAFQYVVYSGQENRVHRGETFDSFVPSNHRFHVYSRVETVFRTYKRIDFVDGVASISDMKLTAPQAATSDFSRTSGTDLFFGYSLPGTTMVSTQPVRNESVEQSFRPATPVITRTAKSRALTKFPDVPVPVADRGGVTDLWVTQKRGLSGGSSLRLFNFTIDSLTGFIYSGSPILSGLPTLQIWAQDGEEILAGQAFDSPGDEEERPPFENVSIVDRLDSFPAIPGGGLVSASTSAETKQFAPELSSQNWTRVTAPFVVEDNAIGGYIVSDPQFFMNDLPTRANSTRSLTWLNAGGPGVHGVVIVENDPLFSQGQFNWRFALSQDPIIEEDVAAARALALDNLNILYNNFASFDIILNLIDLQQVIID